MNLHLFEFSLNRNQEILKECEFLCLLGMSIVDYTYYYFIILVIHFFNKNIQKEIFGAIFFICSLLFLGIVLL